MKKSLSHLPEHKRDELNKLTEIINEMIDAEFVILFGSYARGDWVEDKYIGDDGILYEYKSDYDILIVAKNPRKYEYNNSVKKIENKARKLGIRTDLSIIFHSVAEFKKAVNKGKYFFVDVIKDGVVLYSSERVRIPEIKELSPEERKRYAQMDFDNWFESANEFLQQFQYAYNNKKYKIAAFLLHQTTERFYTTALLTFTGYKPKLHDLEKLEDRIKVFCDKFKTIFPKNTQKEKDLFDLLKRAYVEARYSMSYEITKDELEYLAGKVIKLRDLTEKSCKEKIDSL